MDSALGPPRKMTDRREELTPMMAQYYELCAQYDDALVLFQVGDFYEAFCEAAETVARRCEVTLTKREDSTGQYAMAGLPIESIESYVDRLLGAGYRVAIADQVEDPEETTGVVDRAVTRVLTPGTLTENELLDTDRNNYVGAVANGGRYGLAVLDVSTGEFYATSTDTAQLIADELSRFDPAEVLLGPEIPETILPDGCIASQYDQTVFELQEAKAHVDTYFGSSDRHLESTAELRACGALLSYAEYARAGEKGRLEYLNHLIRYDPHDYMLLDAVALQSLELFERRTVSGHENGTVAGVIDETASALGRRKLDAWLRRPLTNQAEISARHDAVEELRDTVTVREKLYSQLRRVYDIERLISRISRERANARDLRSLKETLDVVPQVRKRLADCSSQKLQTLRNDLDTLDEIRSLIEEAILPNPEREITEGGIIDPAFDDDLERLRKTVQDGKAWVDTLEESERERTGIDSLKVGHNSVHGYYIEITDANLDRVPSEYERRQTLKNAERYYTPELKDREDEILRAEQLADELEYELFCAVRSDVAAVSERIQAVADALAELDVLVSFATVAAEHDYTRPVVGSQTGTTENNSADGTGCLDGIHIEGGRHPVVERTQESFVPNPTTLDNAERVAIITGPNMSGKSTYMRQVALIVILAQVGSFVPAKDAKLGIVDRIFTRVGASDDIAGGRSTFMVEMTELADILEHATSQSLVLLDEVGRGTSTADGFAIAQAVTEHIHDQTGALTLFATHHHDLTAVAETLGSAYNLYFHTTRTKQGVRFEHTVERGTADASYGVEVAATAGVTSSVVERAREILDRQARERGLSQPSLQQPVKTRANGSGDSHTHHTENAPPEALEEVLRTADVATMTPLDALNLLAELQQRIEKEDESTEPGSRREPDLQ